MREPGCPAGWDRTRTCRAHVGAQGEIFLVQLEAAELLRHLGVADDQRTQQLRRQDVERHHLLVVPIGTIARGEPLVEVVKSNKLAPAHQLG